MNKKNSFFFSFFLLIVFHLKILKIYSLIFPVQFSSVSYINYLQSQKEMKELNINNIMKYIFNNKITSLIYIGNPPQKMMIIFNNEEYSFYLSKEPEINNDSFLNEYIVKINNYVDSLSSSFILKNTVNYELRKYNNINLAQEQISFDNITKYNFHFLIDNDDNNNKKIYYGIAGIGLDNNKEILNYMKKHRMVEGINQMNSQRIINNYYWDINYEENKLSIGEEDNISKNNNYQEILTKPFVDILDKIFILDWNILFKEIYVINEKNDKFILHNNIPNPQGNLNIDYGFIIGTPRYRIYLNENFFTPLIKEKKCFEHKYISENKYKSDYYLYSCKKTFQPELRQKFQNLKFYSNELNFTFELNYNDLFININNDNSLLLFMIVFEVVNDKTINYDRWILGEPFLKKYKFLFNPDKKTITFKKNEAIIINSESTSNTYIKIIAIIILFFILLFIGFKIIKNYKVKSRINNINNNKKFYANMNRKYDAKKISNNNISFEMKDSLIFINKNNNN